MARLVSVLMSILLVSGPVLAADSSMDPLRQVLY
jgi:hypothetical protein